MTEERVDLALEGHPLPEKLAAYYEGALSADEEDAIQEHLVSCALCREVLLDLERFLNPADEDLPREGVADLGAAAEWRELHGKIGSEAERQRTGERTAPRRKFLTPLRRAHALAAVLAVAVLGLSLWVHSLRQELSAAGRNAKYIFLTVATVRSAEETPKLELNSGDSSLVMVTLKLPQGASSSGYRVQIQRPGGRPIFEESGLTPQKGNEIWFGVSPQLFESGLYEVTLWGAQQRETDPARYPLEVVRK